MIYDVKSVGYDKKHLSYNAEKCIISYKINLLSVNDLLKSEEEIAMQENSQNYGMPMTLEKHFENLSHNYPSVQEIHSLWMLLKKRIEDELLHSRSVFVNYSFHDGSHSRSIIQAIERFLGDERICKLSATDTFMLLACAYSHDYGMAQTFNKIYHILGSAEFEDFLTEKGEKLQMLEQEDAWAVEKILDYINDKIPHVPLDDLYFSIMLIIQLYLRPTHWKGVSDIKKDFDGLFLGHLKKRFIHGSEGIVEICMCHGQPVSELSGLSLRADGMVGDEYHPRFVATMLRFGDLLDLDNGRFPVWFIHEIAHDKSVIPHLSIMHFYKHEAISHLLITPKRIEIIAHCHSVEIKESGDVSPQITDMEKEKVQKESYEVAALISDWTEQLSRECHEMVVCWNKITQPDFGRPPANLNIKIYVDGREYMAENRRLQMKMSQERVMNLLEGTSIYRDRYVGIREIIQNAVDASLLQLWKDIIQNRYISYGLSKDSVFSSESTKEHLDLLDFLDERKASIFENYDILVEVIKDMLRNQVFIVVKDKGIGITKEDMQYISNIGSSKEKNERVRKLMEKMPAWLKPSGVFGIGLQSVFQLTDCVEFYTRQHNTSEQLISLYSYGKNHGKIEIREVPENADGMYYDNAIPGTNVKMAIEPRKFSNEDGKSNFIYYDPEFDSGEKIDMLFSEISKACEAKIRETRHDYFNIYYQPLIIEKNGKKIPTSEKRCLRRSYIYPGKNIKGKFGDNIRSFPNKPKNGYCFIDNMAYFWDQKAYRCYCLTVRPCTIKEKEGRKQLILPEKVTNLYNISYKFNSISKAESVYMKYDFMKYDYVKRLHAGFIKLDVLILDDQPYRYMNIDRDRLREGAIDEEELLAVRKEILSRWCNYFCEKDSGKKIGKAGCRFSQVPGTLFSLIFLFYQNIPFDTFLRFLEPYKELINSLDITLEGENITVSKLWNPDNLFKVDFVPPVNFFRENDELKYHSDLLIHSDNINRFPHRLVNIKAIQKDDDVLSYYLCLQTSDNIVRAIDMNDGARLYDYINVFDSNEGQSTDFDSIQKKAFKPDSKYWHLLVPCLPHTFRKGRNMRSDLDYCIEWYILSPFDYKSTKLLSQGIPYGNEVMQELIDCVLRGEQFKKCVSYIINKRFMEYSDKEEIKANIINEYREFVKKFYELLREYIPLKKTH